MEAYAREAKELRQPNYLRIAGIRKAMRAVLAGRFADAEQMFALTPTLERAKRLLEPNTVQAGRFVRSSCAASRPARRAARGVRDVRRGVPGGAAGRGAVARLRRLGAHDDARRELRDLARDDIAKLPREPTGSSGWCACADVDRIDERSIAATLRADSALRRSQRRVGGGLELRGVELAYLGYLAASSALRERRGALPGLAAAEREIEARPFVARRRWRGPS